MSDAAGRRGQARLYAVINAALFVALIFQVNYLSFRHYERWDWTEHSIYTLSERTKAVLDELEQPVEMWILLSEAEPEFDELRNLIGRYQAESDRITVHYVDPDRDPGRYREIAQRYELGAMIQGDVQLSDVAAVIDAGERHWEITRDDLISARFDPMDDDGEIELDVESERAITGALVELTTGRATKLCVTTGHNELPVSGGARSLADFAGEMRRENLGLEELELRGRARITREDCDAVAVLSPTVAFTDAEVDLLRRYVREGGNLLVALEPVPNAERSGFASLGLEGMLRDFGIRADRSLVIEPMQALLPAGVGNPIGPFFVIGWGEHAITAPFRGGQLPIVVSEVRSVRPLDENRATTLLTTSSDSYAETDLRALAQGTEVELGADRDDIPGPVSIAVAAQVEVTGGAHDDEDAHEDEDEHEHGEEDEDGPAGGRVVVLGDASMFESQYLAEPTVINRDFASAVVGWLTERQALIAIDARTIEHQPVSMTAEDVFPNLFLRVVVLIPLAFMFLGFAVWWNRRE